MFTAFHHFDPDSAQQVLKDAMGKKEGIGIFEYTERTLIWFIAMLLAPLLLWVTAPFVLRPFTWQRLLWIYIIPLPLLLDVWDGIVSNLRTYSPEELNVLIAGMKCDEYIWDIGKVRSFGACSITYLIGIPKRNRE